MLDAIINIKGSKVKFWLRLSWINLARCPLYWLEILLPSWLVFIKQNGCVIICAVCQIAFENRFFRWIVERKNPICLRIAWISFVWLIMDSLSWQCQEKDNKQSLANWSKKITKKAFCNSVKSLDSKLVSISPISRTS